MRTIRFLRTANLTSTWLVLFVIVISVLAGISYLFFKSTFSPIIVAGGILALVLFVIFLAKPFWALQAAVFAVFLPHKVVKLIPITFLSNYLITFLIFLAGLAWLINVIFQKRRILLNNTILLMLFFLTWSIFTLLWAPNLISARQMLITNLIGLLLLLMSFNQIDSMKAINGLLDALALVGWMLVLAGIGTVLIEGYIPGSRLKVLGINENEYGIQLLLAMPGVFWQEMGNWRRTKVWKGMMTFIYLILVMSLIALSGSRGSVLSLLVTMVAFCFWKPSRIWGLLSLLTMAIGITFMPLLFMTTLERFAITPGDTLLGGREALWQATWNLILDHPWFGVGIGNARNALVPYVLQLRSIGGSQSAATHNPVLQVWAETGLLGILLYMGILGSAIRLFARQYINYRKNDLQIYIPYFAIVSSMFLGYMASWIKGGGMVFSLTYFLVLSLLLIPVRLDMANQRETIALE